MLALKAKLLLPPATGRVSRIEIAADAHPFALALLVEMDAVNILRPAHLRVASVDSFITTALFIIDADV
jgi:hypothetical protein